MVRHAGAWALPACLLLWPLRRTQHAALVTAPAAACRCQQLPCACWLRAAPGIFARVELLRSCPCSGAALLTACSCQRVCDRTRSKSAHTKHTQSHTPIPQGPFPMTIRCLAAGGCLVSNRHNDRFSSNGDKVSEAAAACSCTHCVHCCTHMHCTHCTHSTHMHWTHCTRCTHAYTFACKVSHTHTLPPTFLRIPPTCSHNHRCRRAAASPWHRASRRNWRSPSHRTPSTAWLWCGTPAGRRPRAHRQVRGRDSYCYARIGLARVYCEPQRGGAQGRMSLIAVHALVLRKNDACVLWDPSGISIYPTRSRAPASQAPAFRSLRIPTARRPPAPAASTGWTRPSWGAHT